LFDAARDAKPMLVAGRQRFQDHQEEQGWLASSWSESENNRRAKFYRLTKAGQRQLESETQRWSKISLAIKRALEAEG
jgi:DNA-binding PadR family transcriptional regulator